MHNGIDFFGIRLEWFILYGLFVFLFMCMSGIGRHLINITNLFEKTSENLDRVKDHLETIEQELFELKISTEDLANTLAPHRHDLNDG